MKGDAFLEMAARCGDLPTSTLAVPVLEYVGAQSASWESLCLRAAAWANIGPEKGWITEDELVAFGAGPLSAVVVPVAGLALFARLMAIVMREA